MTKPTPRRLHKADRSAEILEAACALARDGALYSMSRRQIGTQAHCAPSLVSHYYTSITHLRECIINWALRNDNASILSQAMAANDPRVSDISQKQKALVAAYVKE